jgi:TonB family protein
MSAEMAELHPKCNAFGALLDARHVGNLNTAKGTFMRKSIPLFAAMLAVLTVGSVTAQTASDAPHSDRKVAVRVAPVYPDLARKMHIRGIVKVEAVVRANGQVKSTRVLGGNPVLVDAALDAVGKWKFEAAQGETTEVVQLTFDTQ